MYDVQGTMFLTNFKGTIVDELKEHQLEGTFTIQLTNDPITIQGTNYSSYSSTTMMAMPAVLTEVTATSYEPIECKQFGKVVRRFQQDHNTILSRSRHYHHRSGCPLSVMEKININETHPRTEQHRRAVGVASRLRVEYVLIIL